MGQDWENPFGQVAAKSGRTLMMSELLDRMVVPGIQGGPLMHAVAAKAVGFGENLQPSFGEYAAQVIRNASALSRALIERGYHVISDGTDNHLMLVSLLGKGLTGKEAETILDEVGITLNKNMIPFDPESPLVTSGVRVGSPAVTTRGMKEPEMVQIAALIDRALTSRDQQGTLNEVRRDVRDLCRQFPV
jgi:glycine hydroxymethyltransferase